MELRGDVYRQVESGYHMLFFSERLNLWRHIKSTNLMALDSLIATVLTDFWSTPEGKTNTCYTRICHSVDTCET